MIARTKNNDNSRKKMKIHTRIFLVIVVTAIIIIVTGLIAVACFLNFSTNVKDDMLVVVNIPGSILLIGVTALLLSILAAIPAAGFLKHPFEEAEHLRKLAELSSESKSTFLASMSHEIRTPMNSIIGFTELALDDDISQKTSDYLGNILKNADWLINIINDLLDISKIETGRMDLEKIPFDMHDLFENCRSLVMPKAVEKGILLHFYAEPSLGKRPLGDPARLRQVIINLLSNAIKYTNTGMVKLFSKILLTTESTVSMYFEIKDSGIGMTPEQIEKIFSPLIQAEVGPMHRYGGTGLGLSITKNIVELMGGRLYVVSTPGVGSKFSFELIFDTIDVTIEDRIEEKIVINELSKPTFEGEILLCEDNSMNQQVICEHLARIGLNTVVAENGKIGVEMVKSRMEKGEKQFDLILMDIHMPIMDGLEAATHIFELNTGIPIITMTANIMASDRELYKEKGMYDCIGKPFTSQELWRCLMKYFTPVSMKPAQKNISMENDNEFKKSIQLLFVKNNLKKFDEITRALETGDIKLAHRLVHTLKSNAAQIGEDSLQQIAAEIEYQLKDGKNYTKEEQIKTLEDELSNVMRNLSFLLDDFIKRPKGNLGQSMELQKAQELLDTLESLLKSGNTECLKYINDLYEIPGSEELLQQIEEFEFDAALIALARLKERMDI